MKVYFQNQKFLKSLYKDSDLITFRGNFLKEYSNRRYSMRSFIIKILPKLSNKNILDIGCGDCSFIQKLHVMYPQNKFFGLDIVRNHKCIGQNFLDYKIYDGIHFPSFQKEFDLIFCMHTLYHIGNYEKFFNQVISILKRNGLLVITTKSKYTLPKIEALFKKVVAGLNIKIAKQRDESRFCLENALGILSKFFPKKDFSIEEFVLENQIIVDDPRMLLQYIISTARYNIGHALNESDKRKYLKAWQREINNQKLFIDKYIETIYFIKNI